jgi:hypothetical protein
MVIPLKEGNKEGNVTKWRAVNKIIASGNAEVIRLREEQETVAGIHTRMMSRETD